MIFDKTENSFRRDIYPQYKAHRKDPPDELVPQFPLMRATVSAFGMVPIEQSCYEADDIIATYARQARQAGADVLIVSADKDLMQLVEPGVSMYDPASGQAGVAGSREERRFGPDEVKEYFGVGPDRVVDVQALAGDSTDNVPGAPGIGLKTAAQLITEYGDLETLLARASEIKQPKRREALTNPDTVKLIRVSKQLVTLDRDVPVETPLEVLATPELDGKRLISFFKAMELTTLTRRVAEICGVDAGTIEPDPRFVGPAAWPGGQGVALWNEKKTRRQKARPLRRRLLLLRASRRPLRRARRPQTSPPRGQRKRARRSIARLTRSCEPRPSLATGSPARRMKASSRSTPKRTRPIRCKASSSASRWRSSQARPATSRSAIGRGPTICSTAPGSRPTRSRKRKRSRF